MEGLVRAVAWFFVGCACGVGLCHWSASEALAVAQTAQEDRSGCLALAAWQDREIMELRGGRDLRECRETAAVQRRVLAANGLIGGSGIVSHCSTK